MLSNTLKTKIEVKRLKIFFNILTPAAIGGFAAVLLLSIGLFGTLTNQYLSLWLATAASVFLTSVFFIWHLKERVKLLPQNIRYFQFFMVLNCLLYGLFWGVTNAFFYSEVADQYQTYILVTVVVIMSAYFPVFVHYFVGFCVFSISIIFPMIYVLASSNFVFNSYLIFLLLAYLGVMLGFANWFYRREFDRIRLQYDLYEQNEKVKEANNSKSQFLASASHDLRQPLQALGFYIVMLSDFLREPQKKALFDKTYMAYQALENLLNQLLNISKLNANLITIVNTDFSVEKLFEKLRNDFELRAIDQGLSIEFKTEDYFAFSDIVSVERILRNLLENALRYTNEGHVCISCREENEQLILKVEDTGIGIAKSHLNKIFDEFYQVMNPERDRSKGFGLGLYAVDRLAKLLGTSIEVTSQEGKGSSFSITLPLGRQPLVEDSIDTGLIIDDFVLVDQIVLLVDDDDVVLDSISRLFFSWDCQILTADTYESAMDLIVKEEIVPDLLAVDYRLPNHKTGVKLVEEICNTCGHSIPAIILTGDTGEESLTQINDSGLSFMHKPADPSKLKRKVKELLTFAKH